MSDKEKRCDKCGSITLSHKGNYDVKARLEYLGYLAEDTEHELEGGGHTYHGHAIDGTDGFQEVKQRHNSETLHRQAKAFFDSDKVVCPKHWNKDMQFCKSVAPTSNDKPLFAQGKCPECECVSLLKVTN